MIRLTFLVLILAACSRPTPPIPATEQAAAIATASCGADCTSSLTCRDVVSSCRYCSNGICSATLPAEPTPAPDAGIDAAPGGTEP
jgi:hypothetical protein